MYTTINDIKLYYEKHGEKQQTILILPGWGNNRETFTYLINTLKDYFTIYIIDYPGFGNSSFSEKDLTIYEYADLVSIFIKKFNLKNLILIGHSFGGRIISILSTTSNISLKKLILIDVAGIKEKRIKLFLRQKFYKFLKTLKYFFPKNRREKYLKFLFKKFASKDYKTLNPKLYKTFQNIIKIDLKNYYKKISVETLLLWGAKDTITPLHMGIKLNKLIKNSTLIKIDNTYHFPYLEKPYLITSIIFEYLKRDII